MSSEQGPSGFMQAPTWSLHSNHPDTGTRASQRVRKGKGVKDVYEASGHALFGVQLKLSDLECLLQPDLPGIVDRSQSVSHEMITRVLEPNPWDGPRGTRGLEPIRPMDATPQTRCCIFPRNQTGRLKFEVKFQSSWIQSWPVKCKPPFLGAILMAICIPCGYVAF
jgi:hypothetical protein